MRFPNSKGMMVCTNILLGNVTTCSCSRVFPLGHMVSDEHEPSPFLSWNMKGENHPLRKNSFFHFLYPAMSLLLCWRSYPHVRGKSQHPLESKIGEKSSCDKSLGSPRTMDAYGSPEGQMIESPTPVPGALQQ